MREFTIVLQKSVNGVSFGSSREEVRKSFGLDFKEFRKSRKSVNTSDAYQDCNIFYDAQNTFEAIEIFKGSKVIVNGSALPNNVDAIKAFILALDASAEEEEEGMLSASKSLATYTPGGEFENILVARKGYF